MRKIGIPFMTLALVCALAVPAVWAQTQPTTPSTQPTTPATQPATPGTPGMTQPGTTTGQFPTVSNLKPFSAEADYMSLPGYLRYLMYQQTGRWLTYAEAHRAVMQQGGQ
jgi:hypothetical protein